MRALKSKLAELLFPRLRVREYSYRITESGRVVLEPKEVVKSERFWRDLEEVKKLRKRDKG